MIKNFNLGLKNNMQKEPRFSGSFYIQIFGLSLLDLEADAVSQIGTKTFNFNILLFRFSSARNGQRGIEATVDPGINCRDLEIADKNVQLFLGVKTAAVNINDATASRRGMI